MCFSLPRIYYDRRFSRFLDEFEWYVSALAKQRESGTPY